MTYWFWVFVPSERAKPCGGVICDEYGKVIGGAPWFRYHWRGRMFRTMLEESGAMWKRLPDE